MTAQSTRLNTQLKDEAASLQKTPFEQILNNPSSTNTHNYVQASHPGYSAQQEQQYLTTLTRHLQTLTLLQYQTHQKLTVSEFAFMAVNESKSLFLYETAFFFQKNTYGQLQVSHISGVAQVNRQIPIVQAVELLIQTQAKKELQDPLQLIRYEDLSPAIQESWDSALGKQYLYCPFFLKNQEALGGLLFCFQESWPQGGSYFLNMLMDAYQHHFIYLKTQKKIPLNLARLKEKKQSHLIGSFIAILGILAFPVHLTVLAKTEVIPKDPYIITSPQSGVIKTIYVNPNESVVAGQVLLSLDKTDIENADLLSKKQLDVAEAKLKRTVQVGFERSEDRANIRILQSEINEKKLQNDYTTTLLDRADIQAPISGIAVFTSSEDWEGRPIDTGEKIMMLAQKEKVQLEMWLPVNDSMNIPSQTKARFFINSDPINPIEAHVTDISFDAQVTPDQILAYRILAEADGKLPMLGEQGITKIYGERISLFYYIFRKPLSWLRQKTGL